MGRFWWFSLKRETVWSWFFWWESNGLRFLFGLLLAWNKIGSFFWWVVDTSGGLRLAFGLGEKTVSLACEVGFCGSFGWWTGGLCLVFVHKLQDPRHPNTS